jgi:L-seryl-tRNA(Ser) seleniumtransferase
MTKKTEGSRRAIPSVERVLQSLGETALPRPVVVAAVRVELMKLRQSSQVPEFDAVLEGVSSALQEIRRSQIQPVINGTGILVHTNFGRSPLGPEVVQALSEVAANYNNLEYDLGSGERGGRAAYLENCLALLCESEAATVVNNCAAALVLILRSFTREKREVIISRGELVQIGGGFRIPEILEASGALLKEVGTTNQTSLADYDRAIGPETGLILKVHRSNFFMGGFVASPSTEELATLAHERKIPFAEDLGSGGICDTELLGPIEHEPTPAEILRTGVDLVCFSGDKLFGGPQAGIIAGKGGFIAALKKEPFFRALRCDKLILSALQATTELYLKNAGDPKRAAGSIPVLSMLAISCGSLQARAKALCDSLDALPISVRIGQGEGQIGGGTMPRSVLPSVTVDLLPKNISLEQFARKLRHGTPPVAGYISGGLYKIDLRTVFPHQDELLKEAIARAIADQNRPPLQQSS